VPQSFLGELKSPCTAAVQWLCSWSPRSFYPRLADAQGSRQTDDKTPTWMVRTRKTKQIISLRRTVNYFYPSMQRAVFIGADIRQAGGWHH